MTTPVHINGWVQLNLIGTINGQTIENTFSYRSNPPVVSLTDLAAFVNQWRIDVTPLLVSFMSTAYTFVSIHAVTKHKDYANISYDYNYAAGTTGGVTGDFTPNNAALVISWRTGAIGRSFRGRSFMGAIAESLTIGSSVVSAYLTQAVAFAARNITGWTVNSIFYNAVVASRAKTVLTVIVSAIIDAAIDSQRRRLIGRGN